MSSPDSLSNIGVVRVSGTAPIVGIDGDLWFNSTTGALHTSHNGAWVPIAGAGAGIAASEVQVSAAQPTASSVLIWIDTSQPLIVVKYKTPGGWVGDLDGGRF